MTKFYLSSLRRKKDYYVGPPTPKSSVCGAVDTKKRCRAVDTKRSSSYVDMKRSGYCTLACQNCRQNMSHCYNPQCVAADGYDRGILTVNRMLPGPSIQVCYGDKIVVDVKNEMPSQSTTIHWHGLFQRGTPFYDGVPMITQCPIVGGNTFRYQFYANQPGTFYWHSHDGIQKSDGLQGSLVVRRPRDHEPNGQLYDYDLPAHVIVISDWSHRPAIDHFPGLVNPVTATYETFFLINGRGRFTDPVEGTTTTPYSVFRVHPGKRYRFRVVGAICIHCPALLSIDGHNLTIIDTDGNSVKPVEVQALHLHSGERYDFILSATNEVKSYWIRVKGGSTCAKMESSHQKAVLQYQGAAETEPREPGIEDEDVSSFGLVEGKPRKKPQPGNLPRPGLEPGPPGFAARRSDRYSTGVDTKVFERKQQQQQQHIQTLVNLRHALHDKRCNINADDIKLHDIVRPHVATSVREKIKTFGWEVLQHPPYSPDLAPSDFHLFGPMKKFLTGHRFAIDAEVQSTVRRWIMNPQNATCGEGELGVCVSQLEAAEPIDEQILKPDPDVNSTIIINYLFPTVKELYQSNTFRRYDKFIPQDATVDKILYKEILGRLRNSLRRKRPELWHRKNWLLLHDNAPAHRSILVQEELARQQVAVLPHLPYSPDLVPCDFFSLSPHEINPTWT
ncbi:hypothetical protein ANN_19907 [Periplaneta americana]|uniref:Uncharacterized protein n=1 Tax=Periplaneta americana TaxID=6978 RepID=A0ABQ8SC71_PERAM|nr:hypothetical protein ANN_19907 [Periplaneta americana]